MSIFTDSSKAITLPKDTKPHRFSDIEWWYYFASLKGDKGGNYATMGTFYTLGALPVFKGHYLIFSLADLNNETFESHSFVDSKSILTMLLINFPIRLLQCPYDRNIRRLYKNLLFHKLPSSHQKLSVAKVLKDPAKLLYGDSSLNFVNEKTGQFKVHTKGDTTELSLNFMPTKPIASMGSNGKPDNLHCYSLTRNLVRGIIKRKNSIENVTGEGWFDHKWGHTSGLFTKQGWSRFCLQLDDGRELLLNQFFAIKSGTASSSMAHLIDKNGGPYFTTNITFTTTKNWNSKKTNSVFPVEWDIIIPQFNMELSISPDFNHQEIPILGPLQSIWKGTCKVYGMEKTSPQKSKIITGKGFMELVGYGN